MGPKRPQPTTDTEDLSKSKRQKVPLTTKEKIAAAKAVENKAAAAAAKKGSKPRILPPPGEIFRVAKPKSISEKVGSSKPLTTKGKVRAAEAEKKKEDALQKKRLAEEVIAEGKVKVPSSKTRAAGGSSLDAVLNYDPSTLQYTSKTAKTKVTERPTERTRVMQAKQTQGPKGSIDKSTASPVGAMAGASKINILDFPEDVRRQIWELCVVYPESFVRPDSSTGEEQPDLAMTCRKIRAEVLPIYYGKNIFAVDVSTLAFRAPKVGARGKRRLSGLQAVRKWSRCLEEMGWLGMIRQWAISYAPSGRLPSVNRHEHEERKFFISVKFVDRRCETRWTDWDAAIEVHADAGCLLPGMVEHGQCIIQTSPQWLQRAVIDIINSAKGGRIPSDAIVELAKMVQTKTEDLVIFKCEKILRSIEVGQRACILE